MKTPRKTNGLLPGWLIGTWEFTQTTAPLAYPFSIIYHFDCRGNNFWEMPFDNPTDRRIVAWMPYREQRDGYWLQMSPACHFHYCEPCFDEILSVGKKGDLWWMRKMTDPTPDLEYFIDQNSGELLQFFENDWRPIKRHNKP